MRGGVSVFFLFEFSYFKLDGSVNAQKVDRRRTFSMCIAIEMEAKGRIVLSRLVLK